MTLAGPFWPIKQAIRRATEWRLWISIPREIAGASALASFSGVATGDGGRLALVGETESVAVDAGDVAQSDNAPVNHTSLSIVFGIAMVAD